MADLRYALRGLRKAPGFTAVVVLTLALGIGANTAMFSVVNGVLLRPLPYPTADRLVTLTERSGDYLGPKGVRYDEFRFISQNAPALRAVTATTSVGFNLFAGDRADRVDALRVSTDYFRVLGVQPRIGRAFSAAEDQPNGPRVAILSDRLWRQRFGGEPGVIGQSVLLDGEPYLVVGVMPRGFQAIPAVDVWSTLAQVRETIGSGQNLQLLGRLAPGVSVQQADAQLSALSAAFRQEFPGYYLSPKAQLGVIPYRDLVVRDAKGKVGLLFGAILLVLLIGCANVASLLLGRATARGREMAVRAALGASRLRLARLLLTESLLLALAGGAAGVLLASWGLHAILAVAPSGLPRVAEVSLDGRALLFALGLSVATALMFGLVPALRAAPSGGQEPFGTASGRSTEPLRRARARGLLLSAEVALSLCLLVGAGLLIQTVAGLTRSDLGFRSDHLLTAEIWLTGSRYDSTAAVSGFYRDLIARVSALPGVQSAAAVEAGLPLERGGNEGVRLDADPTWRTADYRTITPDYFQVLGTPLLRGRMFAWTDETTAEPVALVNQTFARTFLPDSAAVGHIVKLEGMARRIVGVVGDVRSSAGQPAPPSVFVPSAQTPADITRAFVRWFPVHVVVRTTGDPRRLRHALAGAIQAADPYIPVGRVRTMREVLGDSLAFERFTMLVLTAFAGMALVLAAVGIYGAMSYLMAQRTREIGIRMALGALPGRVVTLMLRRGLAFVALGAAVGAGAAAAFGRVLAHQVFGVHPQSPAVFLAATGALLLVAVTAAYLPARRATRVDPMEVLKEE